MPDGRKNYILMHQDVSVAEICIDGRTAYISAVGQIFAPNHLPIGTVQKGKAVDRSALNEWWQGRAIPASRSGLRRALDELQITSSRMLLEKSLGLSLSDQYWVCQADSETTWGSVNFFENSFSEDVGDVLLGHRSGGPDISLMSPDNTSDGWLKKKWTILNGKRCLIKGGSGATQQEPYNEVISGRIMDRLGVPHVGYTLAIKENYLYSVCEDFITPDTELVTAWYVMQTRRRPNNVSVYQHYLDCCEELSIPGIKDALDRMLAVDYLILNEDRHQNNFGVMRDANTLEWQGAAPIYDSGSSLWFDKPLPLINACSKAESKPFKSNHDEQIKLVSSFDWLDLKALDGIEDEFHELLKDSIFIDEARRDALCMGLKKRLERLEQVISGQRRAYAVGDQSYDVTEDRAYSGDGPVR